MQYEYFGLMLDCSRNAVMKKETVFRMIDIMSKIGYNALELYTEDTYEVDEEPYFGYFRGRYTKEEIREIDVYARSRGVELIPCIQTLAHFSCPSRLPVYSELWDTGDILLVGEERTYQFLDHLFAAVAEMFSSRHINIGMDEAHFIGLGKYLDKHGFRNRFDILAEHLRKVAAIAEKYGFVAHMWSDMFFRLVNGGEYYGKGLSVPGEVIAKVPDNVELCYWDYNHVSEADYDEMIAAHRKFGKNLWFAGGVWSWCSYAPYNGLTQLYMKPAMKSIRKNNIKRVFFTMWGDNGKDCSFFALLPSLYAVKRYSEGVFDDEEIKRGFREMFGFRFDLFMLLDLPNRVPSDMSGDWLINPCKCLLFNDCFLGIYDDALAAEGHIAWDDYAKCLKDAAAEAGEFSYIFKTLSVLCSALAIKGELGLKTRKAYRERNREALLALTGEYEEAARRVQAFHEAFCDLWLRENKPFGLEVQEARIGGVILRLRSAKSRILRYLNDETEKIDELEESPMKYSEEGLFCYRYADNISTGLV